jgi:hypothetical protein
MEPPDDPQPPQDVIDTAKGNLDNIKLLLIGYRFIARFFPLFVGAPSRLGMGFARISFFLLVMVAIPVCVYLAVTSFPQVRACFQASYDAESMVNKSRADFVIHNSIDVRDQPQFVDVLFQWRGFFKDLENRVIEQSGAACSPLYVNEIMSVIFIFVLLAAVIPGGGIIVNVMLQSACAIAASIALLMRQQHVVHSAFDAIIGDLRHTMAIHILPLTNQDDHYLYSLIYASTALRKSEETSHVMRACLQLPGLGASYDLAPAHAGMCCTALALLALWLAAIRYIDRGILGTAGKSKMVEKS